MSWRDGLRQASWRGIEVLYRSVSGDGGRRLIVHEYPGRELGDVEDQGGRQPRFRADLFLLASALGGDYWPTVDRLREALARGGEGTFVHPYRGPMQVHAEEVQERYSTREGGIAKFQVSFVKAGQADEPRGRLDTAAVAVGAADDVATANKASFLGRFNTQGWPEFVRDHASGVIDTATDALDLPSGIIDEINNAASIADVLQGARAELATLGLPRIRGLFNFGEDLPAVSGNTPTANAQQDNQQALTDLVQGTALAAAVDAAAATDYESRDDALAALDTLVEAIDDRQLAAGDDEYVALVALRAAVVRDLHTRGAQLERVTSYTPPATIPSLVLAHRLYGDARREDEIVRRNRRVIRHPGFVPGGEELEVLTDAA